VTETVERRPASIVVVRLHKPKFVRKDRERNAETEILIAPPPELPIERGLAGPAFLADTIVRRWQDHLPLYRLESIYAREGLELARWTICGWHAELADLAKPVVDAMWLDARGSPYLCTDATGVLVQAKEKCRSTGARRRRRRFALGVRSANRVGGHRGAHVRPGDVSSLASFHRSH